MPYKRKGSNVWQISVNGVRKSSGTEDEEEARALERKLGHAQWLDKKMGIKPPRSWKEACVEYSKEKAAKRSLEGDLQIIEWFTVYFGKVEDLNEITRAWVDDIMRQRKGVSLSMATSENATANRYTNLVGSVLSLAESVWEWGNKAPKLKKYPERKPDPRAATLAEWRKLRAVLLPHWRRPATFALATGLREARVFGLKWKDLEDNDRAFSFEGHGNKLGNCIPLNQTALNVIEECRAQPDVHKVYVFSRAGLQVKEHQPHTWAKAIVEADIPYLRWHDLRVTFNSWLAKQRVPEEIRKRLMGHSTGTVQDRYTLLDVEWLRPYSALIDEMLSPPVVLKSVA